MDKKKHKRIEEGIMKPADLKKTKMQRVGGVGPSSSSNSSGGLKAKLEFRALAMPPRLANAVAGSSTATTNNVQMRPILDDKWKEFGDTINFNIETFAKSIKEASEQQKFNKIARMIVAAFKDFLKDPEKMTVEYRVLGTIAEVIKKYGDKLNHTAIHRGLLYIVSNSRAFPEKISQAFIAILTSLAEQQNILDKTYLAAYLHEAIASNSAVPNGNRYGWIEKAYSEEVVKLLLAPFRTGFPDVEDYAGCQLENFQQPEVFRKMASTTTSAENAAFSSQQMSQYLEILRPWFETIRGELLPKSVFRVLALFCGCEQVRHFIATRLEIWIGLQKYHREMSELLLVLGCNLNANNESDREVIEIMLKVNTKSMKTRTISGPFNAAIRKACIIPANNQAFLEVLAANEITNTAHRSQANLNLTLMILGSHPIESIRTLAKCCANDIMKEKETTKAWRMLLRELIRGFNHARYGEFAFSEFATSFLSTISSSSAAVEEDFPKIACDLLVQVPLLTISALLVTKENAFSPKYNLPQPGGGYLMISPEARITREKFQKEYKLYCEAVIRWLLESKHVFSTENSYIQSFYHLLFLETQREQYANSEGAVEDISNFLRIFGECGISEEMFILIFEKNKSGIPHKNALEIAHLLTQRAASHHPKFMEVPLLQCKNPLKLIEMTLKTSIYTSNELAYLEEVKNVRICGKNLYWSAWNLIVLWLGGGEVPEYFSEIYESHVILRYLVFVVMLRKFEFPIKQFEGKDGQFWKEEDSKLWSEEMNVLGEYEKRLIRPAKSLSSSSCFFYSKDQLRSPPSLEELRMLANKFKLASRFCQSKTPPLLSELISNVGAQNALPAINEMLSSDSSTVYLLSSECLFHAIVSHLESLKVRSDEAQENIVLETLLKRAENTIKSAEQNENDILIRLFITALSSPNHHERQATVLVFKRLFPLEADDGMNNNSFDIESLSKMDRFEANKKEFLESIASAVGVESDEKLARMYLKFLAGHLEVESVHKVAGIICEAVKTNRSQIRNQFCEFFVNYVDFCMEQQRINKLDGVDEELRVLEIATTKLLVNRRLPGSIIELLSNYKHASSKLDEDSRFFEVLIEMWLSPGALPKILTDGKDFETFLTLEMKMNMLKSHDKRVVEAALEDLKEEDAQKFLLVPQMAKQTAEMVIQKAENMNVEQLERSTLSNMYLIVKGYQLNGVKAGATVLEKIKSRIEALKQEFNAKNEEALIIDEKSWDLMPPPFLDANQQPKIQLRLKEAPMLSSEVPKWLKANCGSGQKASQLATFHLPPSLVQAALSDETAANSCLQHVEANLKYFLSNEAPFQTIMMVVDTASHRFENIKKRLEILATRVLKSAVPPPGVLGLLKKHAANCQLKQGKKGQTVVLENRSISNLVENLKKIKDEGRRMEMINRFISNFVHVEDGELVKDEDVVYMLIAQLFGLGHDDSTRLGHRLLKGVFSIIFKYCHFAMLIKDIQKLDGLFLARVQKMIKDEDLIYVLKCIWEMNVEAGNDDRMIAEKCISTNWTTQLKKIVACFLLESYQREISINFIFHFLDSYCRTNRIASYRELFLDENRQPKLNAFRNLSYYFADVTRKDGEYETNVIFMISCIESEGGAKALLSIGEQLLLTSCSHSSCVLRNAAGKLLEKVVDKFPYLSYKDGVAGSMRILSNIENRETCIRKCEQIVDRLVEVQTDESLAMAEDVCEEERPQPTAAATEKKDEEIENVMMKGLKRIPMDRKGGPPAKRGKWQTAKEAANGAGLAGNEDTTEESGTKWDETTTAMAQFSSMLREHPSIVKLKLPVLANFVSTICVKSRKELKDEHRIQKVELILNSVILLCQHMESDEFLAVDTALTNCFEFYEKHVEEGVLHVRGQIAFSELLLKACVAYLNKRAGDARSLLRDNQKIVERVCKRSRERFDADLILDSMSPAFE